MSNAPPTITTLESNALLDVLLKDKGTSKQKALGIRNYLIGLMMLDAGLRVGEVVKLRIEHLFFSPVPVNTLVLTEAITKNHVERIVPTSQRIRHGITAIHHHVWGPRGWAPGDYAFTCQATKNPITTRQVERIITRASVQGIGRAIHPHILRHTFASRLMRTVSSKIVQELLGHKDLFTTQIYMHPNHDDLKKAIDSLDDDGWGCACCNCGNDPAALFCSNCKKEKKAGGPFSLHL